MNKRMNSRIRRVSVPVNRVVRNRFSESARSLAKALGWRVNRLATGVSTPPPSGLVVNWGCSRSPVDLRNAKRVFNAPGAVALATDKLASFRRFAESGVPVPPFWTDKVQVDRRGIVLARTKLRGSGGDGIVVVRDGAPLPDAPLYTGYIRKDAEERIHVVCGKVVAVQQKRRDSEAEQTADQKLIRNHNNGWVFAVHNVVFRDDNQRHACEDASIRAIAALGLDFGAVDLVVARKTGAPYVLEVNTAPGIESPTILEAYRVAFLEQARGNHNE